MQVVDAASDAQYGVGVLATGIASFVLLAGMFGLSVVFGYAGLPHLRGRIPTRAALGLHCLVTGVASHSSDLLTTIARVTTGIAVRSCLTCSPPTSVAGP